MTTRTFSTVLDHASDTAFRAWATEVSQALDFVGLTKTSDTGQINLATATRPAVNTAAGYEIRYLNDSLHSTAPIVMRIEYGTQSALTRPAMWITVGTGSNGSGTITGVILSRQQCTTSFSSAPSATTPAPTYACRSGGQFGFAWKSGLLTAGIGGASMGFFGISRTVDNSGADTAEGVTVYANVGLVIQAWSALFGGTIYPSGAARQFCMVPYSLTASLTSGNSQAFRHYGVFPRVRPVALAFTVLASEVPMGNTITLAPAGSTTRTYLSTGLASSGSCVNGGTEHTMAMIWE